MEILYDSALSDYQKDLVKIVNKYRHSHHHLSAEEIISEINLSLVKKKGDLIDSFEGVFCNDTFKRIAYAFAKNCIGWSQGRLNKNSYISRRVNYSVSTEEGVVSAFDIACSTTTEGEEPSCFDSDKNTKCAYILKMVRDYCHILTEQETKVLALREEGHNLREMAVKLGVTHQAISITEGNIKDKIKAHLNVDPFTDDSSDKVSEGKKCIVDLFGGYPKFSDTDRTELTELVKSGAKGYTGHEIARKFKKGKFTPKQIYSFCAKNHLSPFLRRISYNVYTKEEEETIVEMALTGSPFELIVRTLGKSTKSLSSKLNNLVRKGRLLSYPDRAIDSLNGEDKKILRLFKDGHSSAEIAAESGVNVISLGKKRGHFTKKGLLPHAG